MYPPSALNFYDLDLSSGGAMIVTIGAAKRVLTVSGGQADCLIADGLIALKPRQACASSCS